MRKMKMILSLLLLTVLALETSKVHAWGPVTHVYYTRKALERAKGMPIASLVEQYYDWFLCGMMFPDVTVIYYYTQWKAYSATHAWTFQSNEHGSPGLWQDAVAKNSKKAMAFAIGVGVHLIQDCVTHNYYIPMKIRVSMIQNNIIHPLTEGFVETKLIDDPEIGYLCKAESSRAFVLWNKPIDDSEGFRKPDGTYMTIIEWTNKILGGVDFSKEAGIFDTILSQGQFYTKGFAIPREAGGWWSFYGTISDIISFFVKVDDAEPYIQKTIEITANYFKADISYGGRPLDFIGEFDPTGYEALKSADSYVVTTTIIVTVIAAAVIMVYHHKRRKAS